MTSRNIERGNKAVEELNKLGLEPKYHQLDIDDELSVFKLKDYLLTKYGGLDVLVNNAAVSFRSAAIEPFSEQAAVTLRTNFFSTHNVCTVLFPLLKPHARVVNVSSSAGHLQHISNEDEAAVALKTKLSSAVLTNEELVKIMKDFVE